MNLLEIGKIVRTHGIKGAVKVISFVDEDFKMFKHIYISNKKVNANITKVLPLNGDAFSVTIDVIPTIEVAETYRNQSIYIDRDEYPAFQDRLFMSDLINKPVVTSDGKEIGYMVDYDDYGASIILTIKSGFTSYQIPYVEEVISYSTEKNAFIIDEQKFIDMRI